MHPLASSLGEVERDLLRETEDHRIAELDEDALVDLHKRIRRSRNKYVGIYRRAGSAKVGKKGGRGLAKEKNTRNAARAEVFEDALARVSAALGRAAAEEAEQLKAARLAAANPPGTWPGSDELPDGASDQAVAPKVSDRTLKGSGRKKRNASSAAKGARRQRKRDAR